jgi:hypothetical protein
MAHRCDGRGTDDRFAGQNPAKPGLRPFIEDEQPVEVAACGERPHGSPEVCGDGRPLKGRSRRRNRRLSRQSQVLSFATGRSCGASARVCGRGVLSRHGPRPALHHGRATASDRGEDAMLDHRDPPPLAQSRPRDEPCGTSALGRVPPPPLLPLIGSARRTRSHPDPDRDPRPERAHLGRSSPPGKRYRARCRPAEHSRFPGSFSMPEEGLEPSTRGL